MNKNQTLEKYDAVIIGAGLGGLSAAAHLAKKGNKVVVLERHYLPGGYATEFKRKKYIFDVALHLIGGVQKGTYFRKIFDRFDMYNKMEFIKPEYTYEVAAGNEEVFKVPNGNVKKYKKVLFDKFPENKLSIRLWFGILKWVRFQINVFDNFRVKSFLHFIITMFLAPLFMPFLVFGNKIKLKFFFGVIKNPKLKKILNLLWLYYGLPISKINSQFYLLPTQGYTIDGGYYLKGGGQEISNQFVNYIENNNGKVLLKNGGLEIITENNKAVGVKAKDGKIYSSDTIISNASPYIVYNDLLKSWEGSKSQLDKVKRIPKSISCCSLYIGLNTTIENLNPKFKDTYQLFVADEIAEDDEVYDLIDKMDELKDYDRIGLGLAFHSNVDKYCCPEGHSIITVFIGDTIKRWSNLSKEQYKSKKKEEIEKILKTLEKTLPDIRKYIEVIELGTPKTMVRYTQNEEGAIYGFAQTTKQGGLGRYSQKSPLKGLFFSGAWTFPGGGFEGAIRSGERLVEEVLEPKMKFQYLAFFVLILAATTHGIYLGLTSLFSMF